MLHPSCRPRPATIHGRPLVVERYRDKAAQRHTSYGIMDTLLRREGDALATATAPNYGIRAVDVDAPLKRQRRGLPTGPP